MGRVLDLGKIMITPQGDWDEAVQYESLSVVYFNGDGYLSLRDNIGVRPDMPENDAWMRIVKSGCNDYSILKNKPRINGVELEGNITAVELGIEHPYISLERLRSFLYQVTFDKLPEDDNESTPVVTGCSSYVKDGKLYTNLDWDYDNTASFIVRTRDFAGQAFIKGLEEGNLDDALIAQLPYRVHRGVNNYGISLASHILYNDWGWTGSGDKSINLARLPFFVLSRVKSMETIAVDLEGVLNNLYCPEGLAELGYLLQLIITDGTTTYALLPPTSENERYMLVNISEVPKLTNFRWVAQEQVSRFDENLQARPTGIERWNAMPCELKDLRFTKAYEAPDRLSEFIGLRDTTKESSDAELMAIYEAARVEYLKRKRDGKTWHTMESAVYGDWLESLWIQENFDDDCSPKVDEATDEDIDSLFTNLINK